MTYKYRRPLVALLLAVAVVGTATLGSAATLTVNAASISTFTVTHPCPGNATAVPAGASGTQFTGVTVTLPSTACNGRVVHVTVLNGTTVVRQGQATVVGATATVAGMAAYTAQSGYTVRATVSGWNLPTTWSYTPPPVSLVATCRTTHPNATCAADVVLRPNPGWTTGYDLDITIRDTRTIGNSNAYAWTIEIDFSSLGYPFVPTAANATGLVRQSTCAARPVLTMTGVTGWGEHHLLRRGDSRTVWLQPLSTGTGSLFTCP